MTACTLGKIKFNKLKRSIWVKRNEERERERSKNYTKLYDFQP